VSWPAAGEETTLARRFALRRWLRRSQVSSRPAPHAGVGLPAYVRATSPLRRYLDLVMHQQIRQWLRGQPVIGEQALFERLGANEALLAANSTAENLARRHWTLVYLLQNPEWQGEGVIVEVNGPRAIVLVPELALEAPLHLRQELPLDTRLTLAVQSINLPELEVRFNVV
jgi:exoribonuclease-2